MGEKEKGGKEKERKGKKEEGKWTEKLYFLSKIGSSVFIGARGKVHLRDESFM